MNRIKGGLINELEMRIDASKELQWQYEKQINILQSEIARLNDEYVKSMKVDINLLTDKNLKFLLDYRQSIINEIISNNEKVSELSISLGKQSDILGLLSKCHYFVVNF